MSVIKGSADDIILRGGTLWSGSWTSGTIDVPDTDKYTVFKIGMSGQGVAILAVKHGTHIRGIGGYSSDTPTVISYQFTATFSDNTWTFVACNSLRLGGDDVGVITNQTVTSIVGII